jgi:3-hydroxyisobutyrate dehydrogenase
MTTVAVLGTGIMGAPMATVLAGAGFDVRVWNRSRDKAEAVAKQAGDHLAVADTPAQAAAGADVVLTMLLDADAVESAMTGDDGALAALGPDAVWLQASTVGVDGCARLAALADGSGVAFVDAPVLGTRQPAEKGQLVVLASGPDELLDRLAPVFEAIGQRTMRLGEAGTGSRLKLVVNSWVLAVTTAVAEAMALADGLGLEQQAFLTAIEGGTLDLPYAHLKGGLIIDRDFPPSFPVEGAAKDAGLVTAAAQSAGVRMAVATAVREQMERAAEDGHTDEDMAAVYYAAVAG